MLLATHALAGAFIGKNIDNPWLIIVVSLAAHYVLDTFRHGEYLSRDSSIKETSWKVALDLSIGILLILAAVLFSDYPQPLVKNMFLGAFFSMFPDLLTFLYWKGDLRFLRRPFEFHAWTHLYPPLSPEREWNLKNMTNDILISLAAIILLWL